MRCGSDVRFLSELNFPQVRPALIALSTFCAVGLHAQKNVGHAHFLMQISDCPTSRWESWLCETNLETCTLAVEAGSGLGIRYEAIHSIVGFTGSAGGVFRGDPRREVLSRRGGRRHCGGGHGDLGAAKSPKAEREGFRRADGKGPFGDQRKTEGSRPVKKHNFARQPQR